jgi:Tfp pilus assembly protein PilF
MVTSRKDLLRLRLAPWGAASNLPTLMPERGYLNIYPYNYFDTFGHEVVEREFPALVLENEFLRATVVPAFGCRLFSLFDKLANREVFCRPDPILPTPIMLRGAFMPLGIEFNFPCGHNVLSAETMPCAFFDGADGGQGIRIAAYNAVTGIDTTVEIVLRPGERVLHTRCEFRNPLPVRNGFMYWANAAVTQTPEMTFQCKARMSHFFSDYNTYPIVDGLDLRVAKNRHFASDAFAIEAQEDWFGFYSPENRAGAIHLAARTQMRGQKFFTFGFDQFGFAEGRTMGVGATGYMEFQAGILETQYEFLHLEPGGNYVCDEAWVPFHDFGNVSHATQDFILSHESGALRLTATRELRNLAVCVTAADGTAAETALPELVPGQVCGLRVPAGLVPENYRIRIVDDAGCVLLDAGVTEPVPATPAEIAVKQAWLDLKPDTPEHTLELAFRHYKARRFGEAEKLARAVSSDARQSHAAAASLLAEIAWWRENGLPDAPAGSPVGDAFNPNREGERHHLEARVQAQPTDAAAQLALGNFFSCRDQAKARELWQQALAADPRQWRAARNLGYLHLRVMEFAAALPLYRQAIAEHPDDAALQAEFLYVLRGNGLLAESAGHAAALPAALRDDYRIVKLHAYALCDTGQPWEALELLTHPPQLLVWEGEVMHHKYYLDCLLAIGLEELARGHFAAAEHAFRRMLEYPEALNHGKPLWCNEAIAFYHLGLVAEALGKPEQARAWWRLAVEQDYPLPHHWISYRENEYFGALAARRLGDEARVEFIAARLLEGYCADPALGTVAVDLPLFNQCWRSQLGAARGFLLRGETDHARRALDRAGRIWGPAWILAHARAGLT